MSSATCWSRLSSSLVAVPVPEPERTRDWLDTVEDVSEAEERLGEFSSVPALLEMPAFDERAEENEESTEGLMAEAPAPGASATVSFVTVRNIGGLEELRKWKKNIERGTRTIH